MALLLPKIWLFNIDKFFFETKYRWAWRFKGDSLHMNNDEMMKISREFYITPWKNIIFWYWYSLIVFTNCIDCILLHDSMTVKSTKITINEALVLSITSNQKFVSFRIMTWEYSQVQISNFHFGFEIKFICS